MICISMEAEDLEECEFAARKYSLIEYRLDKTRFDLSEIKQLFSIPIKLIATCRAGRWNTEKRTMILITAIESGAMYVDIEYDAPKELKDQIFEALQNSNCKLILSYHNDKETPSSEILEDIISNCNKDNPDIIKIACTVNSAVDNIRLLSLYNESRKDKFISIGMGDKGRITRIAAPYLTAPFTYASISEDRETALGQFDIDTLKNIMNLIK